MTLIAEDLLLLLLDDESGTLTGSSQVQVALGGAVLAELALVGAVEVGEKQGFWHTAKVTVVAAPPADPVLTDALAVVAEKERTAQDLVNRLGKGLKDVLAGRLVARGLLRREQGKILGLFPRTRWPAADSTHEDGVRRALVAALVQGQEPDARTGSLVALLSALDRAHTVVEHEGMSNGEVKERAKQVAEGAWAAEGVKDAVAAANAAMMVAITASTTAAAGSSGT